MPESDEASLVVVRGRGRAEALAEELEIRTGSRARSFTGVRDPATGVAQSYVAIPAPVVDVSRLAGRHGHVWPDFTGSACIYRSISTIKADIAARVYNTSGQGIVWAVFDTGVDASHPHFKLHDNLNLPAPLRHLDLAAKEGPGAPLSDEYGHGTFMAGIIGGENHGVSAAERVVSDTPQQEKFTVSEVPFISGIAPKCKILSVKVLKDDGQGSASTIIEALSRIQEMNDGGRQLRVHGINMGVGFDYDVQRFACGRTPLCMEVDRIVRSGVVVVTSAGNSGFGQGQEGTHGVEVSIQDPGNAELAITVGATHRELPHMYGISYFSSKGPTLDGRAKPDLVAPGERIVSCASGWQIDDLVKDGKAGVLYFELSGTSVATAHVSGACAALISARTELKGQPELLKALLMQSAVDLRRSRFFQGSGMIDVMQALQTNLPSTLGPSADEHFSIPQPRLAPPPPPLPAPRPIAAANPTSRTPLRVMYSYAHEDEQYKNDLHVYLGGMRNQGLIDPWQDRLILPGAEFDKDIAKALEQSDIIVLLVSASFLDSKYCWGTEMSRAVERHNEGTAKVVPIILKPTPSWQETPFGKLTALPKDGKPVTTWENRDLAWTEVAEELRRLVMSMIAGGRSTSPRS